MGGEAEATGQESGSKFSSAFGAAAKAGLAAIGAAGAAAGALVKSSVSAFAEYEQLVGGVTTLFEDLNVDVMDYASQAFKTAGLSANEYMETVMGFSASLNQSLMASDGNIARSADLANQAIIDMSDNTNKMGTSMESIQNAYQGFAKQNYTMLDNLNNMGALAA
jgi:ABC-type transporter Mla subunit MlaD